MLLLFPLSPPLLLLLLFLCHFAVDSREIHPVC
jgi:hypothetical protein